MMYLLTKEELDNLIPLKEYEELQKLVHEKINVNDSLWQASEELDSEVQIAFRMHYRKFALERGVKLFEPCSDEPK